MDVPRVIQKKASEYVATFEPSLSIEGGMIKEQVRNEIRKKIDDLSYEQRSVFDQCVLKGLQQLRDGVKEDAADQIDLQILSLQNSLKNADHQSGSNKKVSSLPVKGRLSLNEKLQIALERIAFFGGIGSDNMPIMSQKEFNNLKEYTIYLIEHEAVPPKVEKIKKNFYSGGTIKYTYRLIHEDLYGTERIRKYFLNFLLKVFAQFEHTAYTTLYKSFSKEAKDYDKDKKLKK